MDQILSELSASKDVRRVTRDIIFDLKNEKDPIIFTVTDYQIKSKLDDAVYEKKAYLWENLPRCFATVHCENKLIRVVCGLRKFGNENQFTTKLNENEQVFKEYYLNKLNGEYFSVSTLIFHSDQYFIFRSKNVSMICRINSYEEDCLKYTDERYEYVKKMSQIFLETIKFFPKDNKEKIIHLLSTNTMNCEACMTTSQHLVDYNDKNITFPFALTSYSASTNGLTSYLPLEAIKLFRDLGFGNLPYLYEVPVLDKELRETIRKKIYEEDNSEGSVVYKSCIDEISGLERVYSIYKYKNYRYIFWRAVREKMRARSTISTMCTRLKNLYCHIDNLDQLIMEAVRFYAYCWKSIPSDQWDTIFPKWITIYKEFQKEKVSVLDNFVEEFKLFDKEKQQLQIMSIGFPGCGKSTIFTTLEKLLPNAKRINQDECQQSSKKFHKMISSASRDKGIKNLLLDKCFHNKRTREHVYQCINLQKVVFLIFQSENVEDMMEICKKRIYQRSAAHSNLYPSPKLESILEVFSNNYEPLEQEEEDMAFKIIHIDMTKPISENIQLILKGLEIENVGKENIMDAINKIQEEEKVLQIKNYKKLKTDHWKIEFDPHLLVNECENKGSFLDKNIVLNNSTFEINLNQSQEMKFIKNQQTLVKIKVMGIFIKNGILGINVQIEPDQLNVIILGANNSSDKEEMLKNPFVMATFHCVANQI